LPAAPDVRKRIGLRTTGAAGDRAFLRRVVVDKAVVDERLARVARVAALAGIEHLQARFLY